MNITCDMAMDLIALYNDGLASDDSRRAVDEHLKSCPECSAAYASYSAPAPHAVSGQPKKSAEDLEIKYMSPRDGRSEKISCLDRDDPRA